MLLEGNANHRNERGTEQPLQLKYIYIYIPQLELYTGHAVKSKIVEEIYRKIGMFT